MGHILIRTKNPEKSLTTKEMLSIMVTWHTLLPALRGYKQDNRNRNTAHIHYMAFGNGATSVDTAGELHIKQSYFRRL